VFFSLFSCWSCKLSDYCNILLTISSLLLSAISIRYQRISQNLDHSDDLHSRLAFFYSILGSWSTDSVPEKLLVSLRNIEYNSPFSSDDDVLTKFNSENYSSRTDIKSLWTCLFTRYPVLLLCHDRELTSKAIFQLYRWSLLWTLWAVIYFVNGHRSRFRITCHWAIKYRYRPDWFSRPSGILRLGKAEIFPCSRFGIIWWYWDRLEISAQSSTGGQYCQISVG
jgi:hypothetical protein